MSAVRAARGRVLVVGAGPAGAAAALAAAARGAEVTVVERAFAGGNAVAHSLLPSKVRIAAARDLAAAAGWGAPAGVAAGGVLAHLRWRREAARAALEARLAQAGVTLRSGAALRFEGPGRAHVAAPGGEREVAFDAAVVATGSAARLPAGLRPDGRRVLLSRDLATLADLPARAVVVGAGPTGVEIASLLSLAGAGVTLVGRGRELLPGEDAALTADLGASLAARGVEMRLGREAQAYEPGEEGVTVVLAGGERLRADALFVATGRRGETEGLGLDRLGTAPDGAGYLAVDGRGATSAPGLFAAGDVTGPPLVANKAARQGAVAGAWAARSAGGRADPEPPRLDPSTLPVAVFAQPEYARVGAVPGREGYEVVEGDDREGLRPHVSGLLGWSARLRLAVDGEGRVAGAALLGDGAAEGILALAAAVAWRMPLARLGDLVPVVPSAGEALAALVADGI
ncbi:MAG: FAD-dependent oxidoreductase [Firmicutes bacterium]|nr:FAD-dependent oxidoreductase [Bacillota bacterium]